MTRRFVRGVEDSGHCLQIREICGDGKATQIGAAELALRVAIERRHDAGVVIANRPRVLASLVAELGGRCSGCGDPIGAEVAICPICRQPQAVTGQKNQALRKRIAGGRPKKNATG